MQSIKEKVSNAASSGKAHVDIYKAKAEEKTAKATARTEEEKEIAHQLRKAKEGQAKMELHQAKAEHAAEKLEAKQKRLHGLGHHHTHPLPPGTAPVATHPAAHHETALNTGTTDPTTYPLGGDPAPPGHMTHNYL